MSTTVGALPLTISERDFQRTVIETAMRFRCRVHHTRVAWTNGGYRTPVEGHPGLPDLIIARDGWVILAELKRFRGRASADQRLWLAALGGYGRLWTPAHWPEIVSELRDGPEAAA